MKMLSCLLIGAMGVGCSSSERDFGEGAGEAAGSGASSKGGDKSTGGGSSSESGAGSGDPATGGSEASGNGGAPGGGSETAGASGASSTPGSAGEAGTDGGSEACEDAQTYCSGTASCSDLTTDAKNCGRCGHDCGASSACDNSRCSPAPIVTGLDKAQGFDVSAKGVFYTTDNTVQHCTNPAKCAATVQQVGTPGSASTLAVTKTLAVDMVGFFGKIAVSDKYAGYISCPASGCGAQSLANPGPSGAVTGLLGDGADLFYQSSGSADPSLSALSKLTGNADGTQGTRLAIGNRALAPARIAVDNDYVYYVRVDTNDLANVVACSRAEGCGTTYASFDTGVPTNFAAYGGTLYWQNGIQLKRCKATDPGATELVTSLPNAHDKDMLIDGKNIYWLTATSVVYCALPSCTGGVKTLVSGLASPSVLRMTEDSLYWLIPSASGQATGGIYRVAKP
ncbi:MAG: hypothetical protein K0R38_4379 [Polyangiaceae bacterium]|nr:hypothetical protein [Polyangiaceae bacterium]